MRRFLSGRLIGLAILLGFQVAVVRLLQPSAYAQYALAVALAALLQTLTSFGIPRVIARFVSIAAEGSTRRATRTLVLALLSLRLASCVLMLVPTAFAFAVFPSMGGSWRSLSCAGAAYAVATSLQTDADGLAQALGLQTASRHAAIGEPAARLALILALALDDGMRDAIAVLAISAATAAAACILLINAVLRALSGGGDAPDAADRLNWPQIRRVAIGGYGGTLSWLAFSPAVIRLIASRVLPTPVFAGFSFVQALVVSAQRYAPSFTLFPLIEPVAMADAARTGRPDRLGAALSLLVKADAILVGAAVVGASVAGAPIVSLLTHGRYGEAAVFLPWLLVGIVANASHRSYEIAAIALGAPGVLTKALGLTLVWMALALATAPAFGVWPLLLCPLGDALTRFWFVQRALTRRGARGVIDPGGVAWILAGAVGASFAGAAIVAWIHMGPIATFGIGLAAAITFLIIIAFVRPIGRAEIQLLAAAVPWIEPVLSPCGAAKGKLRVIVLTPRGFGGTGGVDRLMDSLRPSFRTRNDVDVRFLTTRGPRLWTSPFMSAKAMLALATACVFRRVDVVHVNLGAHGGCYRKMALLAIPRLLKTPYVLHLHGSGFDRFWSDARPFIRRRIDRLCRQAARVIVLGEIWREVVTRRVPDAAARVVVLPNATPLAVEASKSAPTSVVRLLFLGELGARKGSPILIEALARLNTAAPWRAVIAGDGDVVGTRRTLEDLGLACRVSVPGWVGPGGVDTLLAASDILALPSLEENLPLSVIEAFAAGLAVVATPVGALPDILRHGETGLLVPPGDENALAAALRVLIDDAVLRWRLGASARAYHTEHLSLGPYTDRLAALWAAASTRSTKSS